MPALVTVISLTACEGVVAALGDAEVIESSVAMLPAVVPAALARGPVLGVCEVDADAAELLRLGVDEVVRAGASPDLVAAALARARARAMGRVARGAAPADSLSRLVERAVNHLLGEAALRCELLEVGVAPTAALADEFVRVATGESHSISEGEAGRVVAMRVAAPTAKQLAAATSMIGSTLREVSDVLRDATELAAAFGEAPHCEVRAVLGTIASLAKNLVESRARFDIDLPDLAVTVPLSRSRLANAIAELLIQAVHAVSERTAGDARVGLSMGLTSDSVVITVEDNGPGVANDIGSLGERAVAATECIRQASGDVMVDSEPGVGATVRVFLPCASKAP